MVVHRFGGGRYGNLGRSAADSHGRSLHRLLQQIQSHVHPAKNNAGAPPGLPSARVDAWLSGSEDDSVCANDFAIGVLSELLGLSFGWLGTRGFDDDWIDIPHFTHVGLRGGVLPSWQAGLSVEDVDDGPFDTMELETFCDSESGQSGGPVFAYGDRAQYIVGVLSAMRKNSPTPCAWHFRRSTMCSPAARGWSNASRR